MAAKSAPMGWILRRQLLAFLVLGTLSSCQAPATTVETRLEQAEKAWQAPTDAQLVPRPKKSKSIGGEPWNATQEPVIFCAQKEWEPRLRACFPNLKFADSAELANVVLKSDSTLSNRPEGAYKLRMTSEKAELFGRDLRGSAYALVTLRQLLATGHFDPVAIEDWPTLPVRGLLLHTGVESGPTHRRLMERVMVPLKLNLLLVECEYAQWESHPELWDKRLSISKDELKKTVEFAKEHVIEPVPLIETISHMQWFYANDQHKELGEHSMFLSFPADNQEGWKVVMDVCGEAVDLFQPSMFHIGFDEVRSLRGIFPGTKIPVEQVIAQQSERLRQWLKSRGSRTVMWADMLIHKSESDIVGFAPSVEIAQGLREGLSKDIVQVDWQYGDPNPNRRFAETEVLVDAGFELWGAGWDDHDSIIEQARSLARHGGKGFIQTTWPGRILNDRVVEGYEFYQFAELVTAAEAAWNGGENPVADPAATFRRLWIGKRPPAESKGRLLSFQGSKSSLLEAGTRRLTGVQFQVGQEISVTEPLELPVKAEGAELQFLWYARGERVPGAIVANLEVFTSVGSTEKIPLRWGKEVEPLTGDVCMYRAPLAWAQDDSHLHRWGWTAKAPAVVEKIRLSPAGKKATLMVEGITLLEHSLDGF